MSDATVKTPVIDGEYDPERMSRLVANLREEITGLKQQVADAKALAEQVPVLEEKLKSTENLLEEKTRAFTLLEADGEKKALLRERGIDEAYAAYLTGEDKQAWVQAADMFAKLAKPPVEDTPPAPTPDPIITGVKPNSEQALEAAEAHKFFASLA